MSIIERYNQIAADNEGKVVLLRIGDFYEAFGDFAAAIVGDICSLTITTRPVGGERVKNAGIVYHQLYAQANAIAACGHDVLIVDATTQTLLTRDENGRVQEVTL